MSDGVFFGSNRVNLASKLAADLRRQQLAEGELRLKALPDQLAADMDMARQKLQNLRLEGRLDKAQAAEWYENRGARQLGSMLGLQTMSSQIRNLEAQAKTVDDENKFWGPFFERLENASNKSKASAYHINQSVDELLGSLEEQGGFSFKSKERVAARDALSSFLAANPNVPLTDALTALGKDIVSRPRFAQRSSTEDMLNRLLTAQPTSAGVPMLLPGQAEPVPRAGFKEIAARADEIMRSNLQRNLESGVVR